MSPKQKERRETESSKLDIDRRKNDARRDTQRRPWLGRAYEDIYITSYVNAVHPRFPAKVHAFSNLEGESELSPAEWAVAEMAIEDARSTKALRSLAVFAGEMIRRGLVVDEAGQAVMKLGETKDVEHYQLRTGT